MPHHSARQPHQCSSDSRTSNRRRTASRVALMTGRYQYRLAVGLEEPLASRETRDVGLPPEHPTLPSILKKAGYQSTLIGKWHLGRLPDFGPLQSGYDHFYGFRAGVLDYFTHKYGPPSSDTEDLWEDNVKIRHTGYLTVGKSRSRGGQWVCKVGAALSRQSALQRAALAVGGAG